MKHGCDGFATDSSRASWRPGTRPRVSVSIPAERSSRQRRAYNRSLVVANGDAPGTGERSQCTGGWPIHRSACRIYNRSRSDFQTGSQPDDMVGIATTAESHKGSTLGIPFSPPTANSPADCAPSSHCLGKAVSAIPTEVNVRNVPPTSTPISASAVRTRSQAVPRWRSVLFSIRKGANRTSH